MKTFANRCWHPKINIPIERSVLFNLGSDLARTLFFLHIGATVQYNATSIRSSPSGFTSPQMKHFLTFTLLLLAAPALAEDNSRTILDPEKVTPDYAVQGEYAGEIAGTEFGVHVIALGDDKFRAVVYPGGLPGSGYIGYDRIFAEGETKDGVTKLESDNGYALIKNGTAEVYVEDQLAGALEKVERKSTTLGLKPPQDALVLFDGTSADAFKNGKLIFEDLLLAGTETNETFGDHVLHLEFRLPYEPYDRGQARGNSGVYVQGRYEVQVLDSFGLEGEDNECGGIYSISRPKVNACYPPLTWQTYDINFKQAVYEDGVKVQNARITVRHNGIVIHKDLELKNGTPGKLPEAEGEGPLYLQGHGNQVLYRNIWVVKK